MIYYCIVMNVKPTMKYWLSCWWNWVVDKYQTDYEMLIELLMNVKPTMKFQLSCWWILNRLQNIDWVID
jgi:hypothetical protein